MCRDQLHMYFLSYQVLCGEYPEQFVFGGEQCVPMMEYQWEEYVENLRKVNINTAYCVKVCHLDVLTRVK